MNNSIVYITPKSNSRSCGVSDYVNACIANHEGSVRLDINEGSAGDINFFSDIVLQMSGYGYEEHGMPFWLLKKLKDERKNIRTLGIYFHELYAFGPPWRSAFWLSPFQRIVAKGLVELSDYWMTNRHDSAKWLEKYAIEKPHIVLPAISNMGESTFNKKVRLPNVIVFGSSESRALTYTSAGLHLFSWAQAQGLTIHDIGPPIKSSKILNLINNYGVIQHGKLSVLDVGNFLSEAKFGILNYPSNFLGKSSIFAAYCAYGLSTIVMSKDYKKSDGLDAGVHYLMDFPSAGYDENEVGAIASSAWKWYQTHSISRHLSEMERLRKLVYKNH